MWVSYQKWRLVIQIEEARVNSKLVIHYKCHVRIVHSHIVKDASGADKVNAMIHRLRYVIQEYCTLKYRVCVEKIYQICLCLVTNELWLIELHCHFGVVLNEYCSWVTRIVFSENTPREVYRGITFYKNGTTFSSEIVPKRGVRYCAWT